MSLFVDLRFDCSGSNRLTSLLGSNQTRFAREITAIIINNTTITLARDITIIIKLAAIMEFFSIIQRLAVAY